jgi:hypothetical protein
MLELAGKRAWGAHQIGMPVEYTQRSRAALGPDALLAVTQFVILDPARSHSAVLARDYAAAALPNRRLLLQELGFVDSLDDVLVDALIARGTADDVAHRVAAHFDAGAHRPRDRARRAVAGTRRPAPGLTPLTCPGPQPHHHR